MNSKRLLTALAVIVMGAIGPLHSQPASAGGPEIEAAVKAIAEIADDEVKLESYCSLVDEIDAESGDQAKVHALRVQLEDLLRSFGPAYERMIELTKSADLDPADAELLQDAFDALEERC